MLGKGISLSSGRRRRHSTWRLSAAFNPAKTAAQTLAVIRSRSVLESSNPPPRTKATAGLPEQKKAAHVRPNRGVAGGRTGIGNSGLRLACDGPLRLCLQLETGLFVTGASPRGCRRRLVVKSPAIKPSRQHGIREGSSGFDCWKTPAAVAAMLLRKPAGGRRKARGFWYGKIGRFSRTGGPVKDESCTVYGSRSSMDRPIGGRKSMGFSKGWCLRVAGDSIGWYRDWLRLDEPRHWQPRLQALSANGGNRPLGRSAPGRSSTNAGGAEPANGHLGFKHCRPTAGT